VNPLRFARYRLFFAGQSASLLGDGMSGVALAFAVLDLTGRPADLGYVLAAASLPLVGFLVVGGVVADRLERRLVMVGSDAVRFAAQGATAALLLSGQARLWELIVLQVVRGAATAFFNPSLTGLTPALVPPEALQQANVLRGIAQGIGGVAGPALAGVLVALGGPGWALAVDAGTFAVSGACLAALRLPPRERLPEQHFVRDLRDGWREFSSRTWLWSGVIAAGVVNMCAAPVFVLGAALAKSHYGGAGAWAVIVASLNAGGLLGGVVGLRLRPSRPFVASFLGYLWFGLPSLLLALLAPIPVVAAGAVVAGGGLLLGNGLWETTLQRQVPPAALSRVTAYDWFGSLAGQPLGNALVGPLVALAGVRGTLLAACATITVVNLAVLAVPSVRSVRAEPVPAS
jgi:MFS family permease